MAVKRTKVPWMKADAFGRTLPRGLGLNLLVTDIAAMRAFLVEVLGARTVYEDEDFTVSEIAGAVLLLHADHTYERHPLAGLLDENATRGLGVELRAYGVDPDRAEAAARARGDHVLAGALDKPHGLRECHIVAPDGYIFVPSAAIGGSETET